MTLQSSGSMTAAQIASELRTATPITISGSSSNIVNWLGERNGTPITIPTHLYSKSAVKLVDLVTTNNNQSGTMTFNGVSLGPAYTGRRIVVATFLWATGEAVLNVSAVTVGGTSMGGSDAGEFLAGGPTAGAGLFIGNPSGTSATVEVTFGAGNSNGGGVAVLSVAGVSSTHDNEGRTGTGSGVADYSDTVSAASNGVIIQAVCRGNNNVLGWTLAAGTELVDQAVDTNFRIGVAFDNRLSSGNRTVGFTSSGTTATGWVARSYD
jgi:hypothetical protein